MLRFAISAAVAADLHVTLAPVGDVGGAGDPPGDDPVGSDAADPESETGQLWCTQATRAEYYDAESGWLSLEPYLPQLKGGPDGCHCVEPGVDEMLEGLGDAGSGEVVVDDRAYWRPVVARDRAQTAGRHECEATASAREHTCASEDIFDTHPKSGIQHAPLYRGSRVTGQQMCPLRDLGGCARADLLVARRPSASTCRGDANRPRADVRRSCTSHQLEERIGADRRNEAFDELRQGAPDPPLGLRSTRRRSHPRRSCRRCGCSWCEYLCYGSVDYYTSMGLPACVDALLELYACISALDCADVMGGALDFCTEERMAYEAECPAMPPPP